MAETNPYKVPESRVDDIREPVSGVLGEPKRLDAGRGWGWLADGFGLFKRNPGVWIGMALVWFLINLVLSVIPLVSILATVLWPVFLGGFMLGCLAQDEGGDLKFMHLFAAFQQNPGPLFGLGGLYLVGTIVMGIAMVLVVGVAAGGTGLLAALAQEGGGAGPSAGTAVGVVVLAVLVGAALAVPLLMLFWFAPALVALHEVPIVDSLKLSFAGCLRNIVPFLVYGAVGLGLTFLGVITAGLGFLVIAPVGLASIYVSHKEIFLEEPAM